jgi:drug/metabolite transporter (DMT)-like permease
MDSWIPITVFAAAMQSVRTAIQKKLVGRVSANGASFDRFLYGAPWAVAAFLALVHFAGAPIPSFNDVFLVHIAIGGVAQIAATTLLIQAFTLRNFAVGTTYSKTEVIQTAIFGAVLLGETPATLVWVAILVSLVGVLFLAKPPKASFGETLAALKEPAALVGLGAGAFFAVAAVTIRKASLSLDVGDFATRALFSLSVMNCIQIVVMAIYLRWREPGQISKVIEHWRPSVLVGLTSFAGSAGWAMAMTLQSAAYVRALGQVELIFALLFTRFWFRESMRPSEALGIVLVVVGLLGVVLA